MIREKILIFQISSFWICLILYVLDIMAMIMLSWCEKHPLWSNSTKRVILCLSFINEWITWRKLRGEGGRLNLLWMKSEKRNQHLIDSGWRKSTLAILQKMWISSRQKLFCGASKMKMESRSIEDSRLKERTPTLLFLIFLLYTCRRLVRIIHTTTSILRIVSGCKCRI